MSEVLGGVELLDRPAAAEADFGERDVVLRALAQLPPRMRAVLVLRFWEDLSEAGTAEALGCGVTTVRTHTRRGLDKLRLVLAEEAPRGREPLDPAGDAERGEGGGFAARQQQGGGQR